MNSTTAESIIIKVGHGIMTIPRKKNATYQPEASSGNFENDNKAIKKEDLTN